MASLMPPTHGGIGKIPLGGPMWPTHGGPLGPLGPLGPPWGPMGPPWGPMGPMGPLGPHGPQVRLLLCGAISKSSQKLTFSHFGGPKWVKKKLRLRGCHPPSEIRAEILWPGPVSISKMVARRPIWWQKNWFWGPLGFRAQPAHPAGGGKGNPFQTGSKPVQTGRPRVPLCGPLVLGPRPGPLVPGPGPGPWAWPVLPYRHEPSLCCHNVTAHPCVAISSRPIPKLPFRHSPLPWGVPSPWRVF